MNYNKKLKLQFISGHKRNAFSYKKSSRDSNFELLRIIAILFITFHHLLINGINLCGYNDDFNLNVDSSIAVFANSLIVGGKYIFAYFRLVWNQEN